MAEVEEISKVTVSPITPLQGTAISPGVAVGLLHLKDYGLGKVTPRRVPSERIEEELNRFRSALEVSRREIHELKNQWKGQIRTEDARIFDTHLAYLKDPVFVADIESLILKQQMNLEAAVAKVITDFDRIFKLVESAYLRERAVDLRDVAIRVLRNLVPISETSEASPPSSYILGAKELSITDLFNLSGEKVLAIVTEEGGVTSHGAILARSMRIPTVIGIKNLLSRVKEGDTLLVDGGSGIVRINPGERIQAEYGLTGESFRVKGEIDPTWIDRASVTKDGTRIYLFGSCSNHGEVEQSVQYKLSGIGLYRTEFLYLVSRTSPTEEPLYEHYRKVVELGNVGPTIFRLLDLDSVMPRPGVPNSQEANPALGVKSLRMLFQEPDTFRTQIRAILRAGVGKDARILVPFVTGVEDFRQAKEAILEEKWELRKQGSDFLDRVQIGALIEVPAAVVLIRDLVREADFLVIGLDNLVQYTLAADRGNRGVRDSFTRIHPAIVRMLRKIFEVAEAAHLETFLMGETISQPEFLPFLLGVGARRFSVSPVGAAALKEAISGVEIRDCRRLAAGASLTPLKS